MRPVILVATAADKSNALIELPGDLGDHVWGFGSVA